MDIREKIPGVVLFVSCHKHLKKRVEEFVPKVQDIKGWKVHVVIGNPFLIEEFIFFDRLIIVRCEDSYVHLLKKVSLAFEALYSKYDISQGILRTGDDLVFNNSKLESFLESEKDDYVGKISGWGIGNINTIRKDYCMYNHFKNHHSEYNDPMNGVVGINFEKYSHMSHVTYLAGVVIYFSIKCCKIISNFMKSVKYNVFYEQMNYGFPYTVEDVGFGFLMDINGIKMTNDLNFWNDDPGENFMAYHTNKYK